MIREELERAVANLGEDECRVLLFIARRLTVGRLRYGPIRPVSDPREWRREWLEEMADGVVYATAALIQREDV